MAAQFILTAYIDAALAGAVYEHLRAEGYAGTIPECVGVIAFAPTLKACRTELRSVLEDWILVGLRMDHSLPVIQDIDLNSQSAHEPLDTLQTR